MSRMTAKKSPYISALIILRIEKMSKEESEKIIKEIQWVETSKMFISEKKYYLKLIDTLATYGYYRNRETLKELWSK